MDFGLGTYGIAYLAGLASTLSPCVLPLIPILLASALGAHRLGPWMLAAGLALSFALVGTFVASVGVALGLDGAVFRTTAAGLMIGFAMILLSASLQRRFATATSRLSAAADNWLTRVAPSGLAGQFVVGLLLGVVWSPCVGPTLGAASTLASQGRNLSQILALMGVFGLGAATPLVLLGLMSRRTAARLRVRLLSAGQRGRILLGAMLLALGLLIISGGDKRFEAWAVDASPAWLTELTTRW